MSSSNCTDFQSRGLEIRFTAKSEKEEKGAAKEKVYAHMLNATLCATERTMCCILENNQTPEGVNIPECL